MLTAIFCKNSADGLIGMASLKWLYKLSWTLPVEEETNMQKHKEIIKQQHLYNTFVSKGTFKTHNVFKQYKEVTKSV